MCRRCRRCRRGQRCRTLTRLTPIDTAPRYRLSALVLSVSECVEAVSEWCRSVSIDTVSDVSIVSKSVQVSIDTGVKSVGRGSRSDEIN